MLILLREEDKNSLLEHWLNNSGYEVWAVLGDPMTPQDLGDTEDYVSMDYLNAFGSIHWHLKYDYMVPGFAEQKLESDKKKMTPKELSELQDKLHQYLKEFPEKNSNDDSDMEEDENDDDDDILMARSVYVPKEERKSMKTPTGVDDKEGQVLTCLNVLATPVGFTSLDDFVNMEATLPDDLVNHHGWDKIHAYKAVGNPNDPYPKTTKAGYGFIDVEGKIDRENTSLTKIGKIQTFLEKKYGQGNFIFKPESDHSLLNFSCQTPTRTFLVQGIFRRCTYTEVESWNDTLFAKFFSESKDKLSEDELVELKLRVSMTIPDFVTVDGKAELRERKDLKYTGLVLCDKGAVTLWNDIWRDENGQLQPMPYGWLSLRPNGTPGNDSVFKKIHAVYAVQLRKELIYPHFGKT